jgi:hypothetical protein
MLLRIIALLILYASALFAPLWMTALIAAMFMFAFAHFYETVFLAFLMDALYGAGGAGISGFYLTIGSFVSILAMEVIKTNMRFYKSTL